MDIYRELIAILINNGYRLQNIKHDPDGLLITLELNNEKYRLFMAKVQEMRPKKRVGELVNYEY